MTSRLLLFQATADAANAVALYRFYYHNEDKSKTIEWIFVGRYISHFDSIIGLNHISFAILLTTVLVISLNRSSI